MNRPRSQPRFAIEFRTLAVPLLVGVVMCVACLLPQHRPGIWLDEVYSLLLSRGMGYVNQGWPVGVSMSVPVPPTLPAGGDPGVMAVIGAQTRDAHPPAYFVLLRVWRELFGEGLWAARALSIVCVAATAALVAVAAGRCVPAGVGAQFRGRAATVGAVVAGLTFALCTTAAWYGQEIRGYALAMLCSAAALALAFPRPGVGVGAGVGPVEGRGGFGAGWVACALLGLLTHYFVAGAVAGVLIAAQLDPARRRRAVVAGVATAVAFAAVWGWAMVVQSRSLTGFSGWIGAQEPLGFVTRLTTVLATPAALLNVSESLTWLTGTALLAAGAALALRGGDRVAAAATALVLGQALVVLAVDLKLGAVHQWHLRYVTPALPAVAVIAGRLAAAWYLGGRRWRLTAVTGWACVLLALSGYLSPPRLGSEWATLVRETSALTPDDGETPLVFAVAAPGEEDRGKRRDIETSADVLAMLFLHHQGGWRGPVYLLETLPTAEVREELAARRRVLFVTAWRSMDAREVLPGFEPAGRTGLPAAGVGAVVMSRKDAAGAVTRPHAATGPTP